MLESENIDEYINNFPKEIQVSLFKIRNLVKKFAPLAVEKISYGIPTFHLKGILVHFAAYKNHIGFYPGSSGILKFEKVLKPYKHSKGAIQFPNNNSLPLELIEEIVKYRVVENLSKESK